MSDEAYEALRLEKQLCFPIYLCAKEITRRYDEKLADLSLTYTQYLVMMYLWERGETNPKELARCLLLDPSTLTPVLKKLESKGFLTRARSEADERSLVLRLTPAGLALRDRALPLCGCPDLCLGLTESEAAELYRLSRKVLDKVSRV